MPIKLMGIFYVGGQNDKTPHKNVAFCRFARVSLGLHHHFGGFLLHACERTEDYFASAPSAAASTLPAGTEAVATVRFSWVTAVTPFGSFRSAKWIEWPTSRADRSTVTNSGRSLGKQEMSSSVSTWLMMAEACLTAGDTSALTKCRGTLTWIFCEASTRWKSTCNTSCLYAWTWKSRSRTCSTLPSISRSRMEEWKVSFFNAWYSALWSRAMFSGALVPP